jgi:hypothetical protein
LLPEYFANSASSNREGMLVELGNFAEEKVFACFKALSHTFLQE